MKTSELQGAALDWAVAKCSGTTMMAFFTRNEYTPSTDWEQGGSIIEREKIQTGWDGDQWIAKYEIGDGTWQSGPTALIAAMRCFVKSKLGDEIDTPEAMK